MSSFFPTTSLIPLYLTLFSTFYTTINGVFSEQITGNTSPKRVEKTTHLHFYFHDILSGSNPSAVRIISPPDTTVGSSFGTTMMIDDALTENQAPSSKIIGRAQGFYSMASQQQDPAFLMVVNYVFLEGDYKGSSISVLGRNPFVNGVKEMPIVGGSGIFRYAKGYALAHTVQFDPPTGDAVVEYNVYVSHYQSTTSTDTVSVSSGRRSCGLPTEGYPSVKLGIYFVILVVGCIIHFG